MDLTMSPEEDNVNNIKEQTAFETRAQNGDSSIENTHFKCPGLETSQEISDSCKCSDDITSIQNDIDGTMSEDNSVVIQEILIINNSVVVSNSSQNHSSLCVPHVIGMEQDTLFQLKTSGNASSKPDGTSICGSVFVTKDSSEICQAETIMLSSDCKSNGMQNNLAEGTESYTICHELSTTGHEDNISIDKNNICCTGFGSAEACSTDVINESVENGSTNITYDSVETSSTIISCDIDMNVNNQRIDAATVLCNLATEDTSSITDIGKCKEIPNVDVTMPVSNVENSAVTIENLGEVVPFRDVPLLEEYDSDSTIPTSPCQVENVIQSKQPIVSDAAKSGIASSSKPKCFSPLPSTSSDYVTFDLNDMRFNEAEAIQKQPETNENVENTKCESPFIVVDGDTASSETFHDTKNDIIQVSSVETYSVDNDATILICENDNEPVTVDLVNDSYNPNEVIDLLGDDSDCEIIDVDKNVNVPVLVPDGPIDLSTSCEVNFVDSFTETISSRNENIQPSPPSMAAGSPIDLDTIVSSSSVRNRSELLSSRDISINTLAESLFKSAERFIQERGEVILEWPRLRAKRGIMKRDSASSKRKRNNTIVDLSETSISNNPPAPRDMSLSSGPTPMNHMSMGSLSVSYPIYQSVNPMIPPPLLMPVPIYPSNNPSVSNVPQETPTPTKSCLGECPVCYETLSISATASTFCGHVFCLDCIRKVMKTSKKCPKCRKALTGRGFHQLFL